jgi:ATP adenylyltransferase/5',5'''-P-1,P-4-tetraphosphate phosphorylase II
MATNKSKTKFENISHEAVQLFERQLTNWPTAQNSYASLQSIEEKIFDFEYCQIKIQYNPARAISSGAKVDSRSIAERPCFLCLNNLPKEQEKYTLLNGFLLLVNPFPVFNPHFTLPYKYHTDQQILPYFGEMLQISKQLSDYTIFYNGPACGASAPDHLHFQASPKGIMPVESEFSKKKKHIESIDVDCRKLNDGLRTYYLIENENEDKVRKAFEKIYDNLSTSKSNEPMMNILISYTDKVFKVFVFPRKNHRPQQYFAEGNDKILISPGAVDMAGILITSRKEDFDKLTKDDIRDIFEQVTSDK